MMFWHGGGLMWIGMIASCGLLIWAVYAVVVGGFGRPDVGLGPRGANPRRVLDERLARGEIDSFDYRRLLSVIMSRDGTTGENTGSRR